MGVLAVVGLMTVGMTTSAEALPHEHTDPAAATLTASQLAAAQEEIQAFVVPADAQPADITREGTYSVGTLVELASTAGISNLSNSVFSNNRECAVQWPYAAGVPTGSGFGMRNGRMHEGVDFVPGDGAQIQAVADGVVRTSTDNGGAYGVTIVIEHLVDGQTVSSRYAHMQYDSRQVQVGDTVSVGQYIGRTGDTGRSYGAHLHLEIQRGATKVDPMPWFRTYANC